MNFTALSHLFHVFGGEVTSFMPRVHGTWLSFAADNFTFLALMLKLAFYQAILENCVYFILHNVITFKVFQFNLNYLIKTWLI
jgi:hypothetical protein